MKLKYLTAILLACSAYCDWTQLLRTVDGTIRHCDWLVPCPSPSFCDYIPQLYSKRYACYLNNTSGHVQHTYVQKESRFFGNHRYTNEPEEPPSPSPPLLDLHPVSPVSTGKTERERCPVNAAEVPTCHKCKKDSDCPAGKICCPNEDGYDSCSLPAGSADARTYVNQLITGRYKVKARSPFVTERAGSVTLISSYGYHFLVDTGVLEDQDLLLRELRWHNLKPEHIDAVILTHASPEHYGNLHKFSESDIPIFQGSIRMHGTDFVTTRLSQNSSVQLCTPDIVLLGSQNSLGDVQHISVLVRSQKSEASSKSYIAIVGSIFLNDRAESKADMGIELFQSRREVVCRANRIIPGHGRSFYVTEAVRDYYQCNDDLPTLL